MSTGFDWLLYFQCFKKIIFLFDRTDNTYELTQNRGSNNWKHLSVNSIYFIRKALKRKTDQLYEHVCSVALSCLTLWPHRLQPPGSPVCGVSKAGILEWVAISFSSDLPNPRIERKSSALSALQVDSFTIFYHLEPSWNSYMSIF